MSTSYAIPAAEKRVRQSVHRFALILAGCIVLLLIAGALVTSNDAGLAVPDWPLSYGSLMPPMVGGIFYEHGHRVIATIVGMLTIILALLLARSEPRAWVRKLGWTALGLVIAQGLLGGLTVLLRLPPVVSTAHATLAQLFFITILSISLFTSDWWQRELPLLEDPATPKLRSLALITTCVIFLQLIMGAAYRHGGFGIMPHEIGAVFVLFFLDLHRPRRPQTLWRNTRPAPVGNSAPSRGRHADSARPRRVLGRRGSRPRAAAYVRVRHAHRRARACGRSYARPPAGCSRFHVSDWCARPTKAPQTQILLLREPRLLRHNAVWKYEQRARRRCLRPLRHWQALGLCRPHQAGRHFSRRNHHRRRVLSRFHGADGP